MSASSSVAIPYERQVDPQTNRMCGAASLSMVYRSFGKTVPQADIWPKISKQNHLGSLASTTYLMAQDALDRGYVALAIQARHPLQALRLCRDKDIRAVLSHRLKNEAPTGHYTVLVDIDGDSVVLHDPYFGPSRRVPNAALLELWRPLYPNAEITGNVVIGIADQPTTMPPCQVCGGVVPPAVECRACGKAVSLQPAVLLGCVSASCAARLWNYICCPFCDHTWTFSAQPQQAQATAGSEEDPWNLNHVFGELDKFCNYVLSLPGLGNLPDVRKQLDFIIANKEKLRLAQAEELVHQKTSRARLAQLQQKAKQDEEALLKKAEISKPSSPSDGNALGQSLLKGLGLLG
jgi:hypothetical protein